MIEIIIPRDRAHWHELRKDCITSTTVSALFGVSPHTTIFELWNRRRGFDADTLIENERMKWGNKLEAVIAEAAGEELKTPVRSMNEFYVDKELRLGASFDYYMPELNTFVEIKNVDNLVFKNDWGKTESGEIEPPLHIELQVQTQLMLTNFKYAYLAVLVGGNKFHIIKKEPNQEIFKLIKDKVKYFWHMVNKNIIPPVDFEKDCSFISRLYGFAEPEKVLNVVSDIVLADLVETYKTYSAIEKDAVKNKETAKAKILMHIKDAEKVLAPDYTISAGMVGECKMEFTRKAYRSFRINFKKEKK